MKKAFYGVFLLIALYLLWRFFSYWFFAGLALAALPLGLLIVHITQVPRTLVLSMHIAEDDNDADYFSLYGVPHTMLEHFKREGGDFHYITTLEGTQIAVCDSIDFENWKIKNSWFSEISNIEFFRSKQAFLRLKQMYIDEVKANGASRALHSQLVHKHVQNELVKHYDKFDQVMNEPESSEEQITQELIKDATPSNGDSPQSG